MVLLVVRVMRKLGISGTGENASRIAASCMKAGFQVIICGKSWKDLRACASLLLKGDSPFENMSGKIDTQRISDGLILSREAAAFADVEAVFEASGFSVPERRQWVERVVRSTGADTVVAVALGSDRLNELVGSGLDSPRIMGVRFFRSSHGRTVAEIVDGNGTDGAALKKIATLADSIWGGHITARIDSGEGIIQSMGRMIAMETLAIMRDGVPQEVLDRVFRTRLGFPHGSGDIMECSNTSPDSVHSGKPAWHGHDGTAHGVAGWNRELPPTTELLSYMVNPARLLGSSINMAAGLVRTGSLSLEDAERAMVMALGWPAGILSMADRIGLDSIAAELKRMHDQTGDTCYILDPLIEGMLKEGKTGEMCGEGFFSYPVTHSEFGSVKLDRMGNHCLISMTRERKLNSLDAGTWKGLKLALEAAQQDPDILTVFITGSGRAFSAGDDIDMMLQWQGSADAAEWMNNYARPLLELLKTYSKPLVMLVNGLAYGGGCELTMLADIVVAADDALFALPEDTIGAVPPVGTTYGMIVNRRIARYLFTGEEFSAGEAMRLGLVDIVVPRAQVFMVMKELAHSISRNSRASVLETKRLINMSTAQLETLGRAGEDALVSLASSAAFRNSMQKFVSKRRREDP